MSPTPEFFRIDSLLLPLARREMQVLADAVDAAPAYAKLLMHMLDRREAVEFISLHLEEEPRPLPPER